MSKLQSAYDKLDRLMPKLKDEVRRMLELGEITPSMMDFEFYHEDEELNVSYIAKFANGTEENVSVDYEVEISIIVREK